ncbi:hypothetical protein PHYPO_G00226640 [Pangasianodon hypophthalmus]|uniref:Ovochymase-2 n=1 Tax=Pangasianodon hypophthalmus TaxID=310915 RepID=A0A5N5NWZ9_PANHP|nr:hypothetical protein PHYPO_G00226640 [Pangasianodon hypophthalmus]
MWLSTAKKHFRSLSEDRWRFAGALRFSPLAGIEFLRGVEAVVGEYDQRVVDRDDFAQPVCLPLPGEIFPPKTTCNVAGWGRTKERGQMASVLHEVQLNLVDPAICKHILQTLSPGLQNLTVLCAGPERGGKDACQGDSGGPLLCPRADGQWVVVGITSWGKGCGRSWINNRMKPLIGRSSPAVFTNIPVFIKWLLQKGKLISQLSVQDGDLKGSEGIIRYPVNPGLNYSNNEACSWSISVPGDKRILLEFLKFDLENHHLCQSDHLTVFAGEGLPIGRFCGSKSPAPLLIHSNTTTLQFMSDFSVSGSGFSVRFRAVEDDYTLGPGCGTVALFQSPAALQSPDYPRSYGDDTHCRWVIYVPEGYVVKLAFTDFVLEESEGCQYDSLSVFGDFEAREQIVVLCGQSIPPPVLSFGRVMVVQFMTDSSVSARGFSANLSVISKKDLQDGENEDVDEEENDASDLLPL